MIEDREGIKIHLYKCIEFWRKAKKLAEGNNTIKIKMMAVYYIDAYQSMRVSIFDELKI